MDIPLLLVGISSEGSARSWVYPALRYDDRLLLAGRVAVADVTHLFCVFEREGGTHVEPRDYPKLSLVEDPGGTLLLVTAALHHLLAPEVAAVLGRWCGEVEVAGALATNVHGVREAVVRTLPQLREAWIEASDEATPHGMGTD